MRVLYADHTKANRGGRAFIVTNRRTYKRSRKLIHSKGSSETIPRFFQVIKLGGNSGGGGNGGRSGGGAADNVGEIVIGRAWDAKSPHFQLPGERSPSVNMNSVLRGTVHEANLAALGKEVRSGESAVYNTKTKEFRFLSSSEKIKVMKANKML